MSSTCRACGAPLSDVFCDLGKSPLANRMLERDMLGAMEPFWPLKALVCGACFLVQLEEFETPEAIFTDYSYFSSWSPGWVAHARAYAEAMIRARRLDERSRVVEIASNDGYLLQWFVQAGIPVLGVEPAANVAQVAEKNGVPTVARFFGADAASELVGDGPADLMVANNVLAHVPDLHDFVEGFRVLLAPEGLATFEFPHVLRLIQDVQFDTIYHEHFSYLSLAVVQRLLAEHGLHVVDIEELPTHGGSLRVHATHAGGASDRPTADVQRVLAEERAAGMSELATYLRFDGQARAEKRRILRVVIDELESGATIAGYGAAAKGNTLLNYCGIGPDMIDFVADASTYKQGRYLPGTQIPVLAPSAIDERRPDRIFVLPWNLRDEILEQLAHARTWGARFLVRDPSLQVVP